MKGVYAKQTEAGKHGENGEGLRVRREGRESGGWGGKQIHNLRRIRSMKIHNTASIMPKIKKMPKESKNLDIVDNFLTYI